MPVISVINHKGGVGKTALSLNLAAFLRLKKKSVLLIDLDPEGNISSDLGLNGLVECGIGNCLEDPRYTGQSICEVSFTHRKLLRSLTKYMSIIPVLHQGDTQTYLEGVADNFNSKPGYIEKLNEVLDHDIDGLTARSYFDYIIIDCSPSKTDGLTKVALNASDFALISTTAKKRGFHNIDKVTRTFWNAKEQNPDLQLLGIVFNMVNINLKTEKECLEEGRAKYGKDIFKTFIPSSANYEKSLNKNQPVCSLRQSDPLHVAYKVLSDEINSRANKLLRA